MKYLKLFENNIAHKFAIIDIPLELKYLDLLDLGYPEKPLNYRDIQGIGPFIYETSLVEILKDEGDEFLVDQLFSDTIRITSDKIIKRLNNVEDVHEEIEKIENEIKYHINEYIKLKEAEKEAEKYNL